MSEVVLCLEHLNMSSFRFCKQCAVGLFHDSFWNVIIWQGEELLTAYNYIHGNIWRPAIQVPMPSVLETCLYAKCNQAGYCCYYVLDFGNLITESLHQLVLPVMVSVLWGNIQKRILELWSSLCCLRTGVLREHLMVFIFAIFASSPSLVRYRRGWESHL